MKTRNILAVRAIILCLLNLRARMERLAVDKIELGLNCTLIQQMRAWMKQHALDDHTSVVEQNLLFDKIGTWTLKQIQAHENDFESCITLLWAMQEVESMPLYFEPCDRRLIESLIPYPNAPHDFIAPKAIRHERVLRQEAELYHFLTWRCEIWSKAKSLPSDHTDMSRFLLA